MLPRPSAPAPLQGGYSGDREPLRNALWTDVSFAGLRKRTAPLSDDGGAPRLGRRLRAGAVPSCPHRRAVTPCYGPAVKLWIDADAAPRDVKEIVFRTARRLRIETVLVARTW